MQSMISEGMINSERQFVARSLPVRTECMESSSEELAVLPTVADVLAMPVLQAGLPEVFGDRSPLQTAVRWVHVSDSPRVAALLDGGELLLSTGAGWPGDAEGLSVLASELSAVSVSGIVVELGTRFTVMPPAFVEACRRLGVALVGLEREVKFVALTEAVHRRIIASQLDALQRRQQLHELFTSLSLRGAPANVVVRETARVLGAGVVLENLAHEVVAADSRAIDGDGALLHDWAVRSRGLAQNQEAGWSHVAVEARGTRWGTLLAAPGPTHPAGRTTVLEQAATTLALARLADGEQGWELRAHRRLVAGLLDQGYSTPADARSRLEASGFPVHRRRLHAMVAASAPQDAMHAAGEALRKADASSAVLGASIEGEGILLVSLPRSSMVSDAAVTAASAAIASTAPSEAVIGGLAIGRGVSTLPDLLTSLTEVRMLALKTPPGTIRRFDDRPLARLVTTLHGDHRLQEHSERMLAPLIRHDLETGGDLLDVLGALLRHPGNRTAAAAASHLSRSVFYQRLTLIGDLLDADLDDGETLAALHVALLASTAPGR